MVYNIEDTPGDIFLALSYIDDTSGSKHHIISGMEDHQRYQRITRHIDNAVR